jgi:hypothetical protein
MPAPHGTSSRGPRKAANASSEKRFRERTVSYMQSTAARAIE